MGILNSIDDRDGKRKYGIDGTQRKSQKKQRISNEHGWNSAMRTKFYALSSNLTEIVLKHDMTDLSKRPEGLTKMDIRKKHNEADGIWSDSRVDKVISTWENFLKFIIERDEERKKTGFYKENPKVREVRRIKDVNHHDIRDFIDGKLYGGDCQPTTVRTYLGNLKKGAECTRKEGIGGHKNLIKDYHEEMIPERDKEFFVRGKGKTDGKKGYTLEQANRMIEAMKGDGYGQAGLIVLTDIGLRKDTFFQLKWSDVLDENRNVRKEYFELFRPGMMKGGREQIAQTTVRATSSLQSLWETGRFREDEEVFGRFTEHTFKKVIKEACEATGVDYKGFHEFRGATVELYDDKASRMTKEELVDAFLTFVNVQVPHRKTSELYMPHNPIVVKKDPLKQQKTDENGDLLFYKNGSPMMEYVKRIDKNGQEYVPMVTRTDKNGHPVRDYKWTKAELMHSRIDYLRNLFVAEQISHNRPDANSPYRHG